MQVWAPKQPLAKDCDTYLLGIALDCFLLALGHAQWIPVDFIIMTSDIKVSL